MNEYYVYMLTNRWKTVLYTGVTNFETYNEIAQAIAREKQIKGWTRAKKNALVAKRSLCSMVLA